MARHTYSPAFTCVTQGDESESAIGWRRTVRQDAAVVVVRELQISPPKVYTQQSDRDTVEYLSSSALHTAALLFFHSLQKETNKAS